MGRKRKNPLPDLDDGIVYRKTTSKKPGAKGCFHYRYYAFDPEKGRARQFSEKLNRGDINNPADIEEANRRAAAKQTRRTEASGAEPRKDYTVEQIWMLFIEQGGKRGREFKPSTRRSYESTWSNYLEEYFRGVRIADVDDLALAAFRKHLRSQGDKREAENAERLEAYKDGREKPKKKRHPVKKPTPPKLHTGERARELAFLLAKSLLSFAYRRQYIEKNPGVLFQVEQSKRKAHVSLDRSQTEALIAATDPHYAGLVEAALYSGCRGQELICWRWSDIDFRENSHNPDAFAVIEISRAVSRGVEGPTKTRAGQRVIPIPTRLKRTLLRIRDEQKSSGTYERGGLVFTTKGRSYEGGSVVGGGKMIRLDNFRRDVFQPAVENAGLADTGLTFHGLRAVWISWLVEGNPAQGVNPTPAALISATAGHSDFSTTERYIARRDKQLEHIVAIFEDDYPEN